MLEELRKIAEAAGEDPAKVELQAWRNHDIRRTMRSGLSRLRVPEVASEAVLAHVRPGIVAVYDRHSYLPEKREALEVWAAHRAFDRKSTACECRGVESTGLKRGGVSSDTI